MLIFWTLAGAVVLLQLLPSHVDKSTTDRQVAAATGAQLPGRR